MIEMDLASFVFGTSAPLTLCLKLQIKVKDNTNHSLLKAENIQEMTH